MIRLFRGNSAKKRQMAREPEINPLASLQSIKHMNYVSDNMQTSKLAKSWAIAETKVVNILRVSAIIALLVAAAVVATGVFLYTRNGEEQDFQIAFEDSAIQVIDSFHEAIERNMGAVASLSNSITSYALETNKSFPFVTLPHFEIKGSDIRAQSGSHLLHWCPLVSDHNRGDWEEYSFQNRHHATQAIQYDTKYRMEQDQMYGYGTRSRQRQLQQLQAQNETDSETQQFNEDLEALVSTDTQGVLGVRPTTLNDGSNYHPYIWTSGSTTPRGDVPQGSGDGNYMPLWQQSPADARLASALNLDVARSNFIAKDLIHTMQTEQMAVLNMAAEPREISKAQFQYYLKVSQYRHRAEELVDDWHTLLSYPVFDTFDADTRNVAGMITTDIYWKVFFSNLLPTNLRGLVCVITNSFNQTFSYQIDGAVATALGMGDPHDPKYEELVLSTNINSYLSERAGPENRAYQTVHLSDTVQYTIHVYPSKVTKDLFVSNQPAVYAAIVVIVFVFAAFVFTLYSVVVEHRQRVMNDNVIDKVKKAAETERELNEFLSHEIRNPLSAAISACTFVSTAVNEANPLADEESRSYVRDDIEVVTSSLHFINDFLRSMLDIYRASDKQISVEKAPTDIKHDILEPVSNILYKRLATFEVLVDCPDNLVVMTDSIRLKQVILNLVRNASKFVERGFLRMRAEVVTEGLESRVRLFVEDSGPGIPLEKKRELFAKYQDSLDLLSQGTGIGLNLSKKLMHIMGGDLYLDDNYDSGIEGSPGACFVVDLSTPPLDLDRELDQGDFDYSEPTDIETGNSRTLSSRDSVSSANYVPEHAAPRKTPALRGNDQDPVLPEGLKVLFVDDDAMLRKLFVRAVKRATPDSWTIREASSGEMAMKILSEDPSIDLIFLDQYMASVDKQLLGTETASALRRKGIESTIVGLSANDLRTAFVNAGADDFILKPMPCKPDELKRLLHKFTMPKMNMDASSVRRFIDSSRRSHNSRSARSAGTKPSGGTVYSSAATPIPPLVTIPPAGILKKEEESNRPTASSSEASTGVINKQDLDATDVPSVTSIQSDSKQQTSISASPLFAIADDKPTKPLFAISEIDKEQKSKPLFVIDNDRETTTQSLSSKEQAGRKVSQSTSPLFALKESSKLPPSADSSGSNEATSKPPLFSMTVSDRPETKPVPLFSINPPPEDPKDENKTSKDAANQVKPVPLFSINPPAKPPQQSSDQAKPAPLFSINPAKPSQDAADQVKPAPLFSIKPPAKPSQDAADQAKPAPLFSIKPPAKPSQDSSDQAKPAPLFSINPGKPSQDAADESKPAPLFSINPAKPSQDAADRAKPVPLFSINPPANLRTVDGLRSGNETNGVGNQSKGIKPLFAISGPNEPTIQPSAGSNSQGAKQRHVSELSRSSKDEDRAKKPPPLFAIAGSSGNGGKQSPYSSNTVDDQKNVTASHSGAVTTPIPAPTGAKAPSGKPANAAKKSPLFSLGSMTRSHERKEAEKLSSLFSPKESVKTQPHFGTKVSNSHQDISAIIASVKAANQQK